MKACIEQRARGVARCEHHGDLDLTVVQGSLALLGPFHRASEPVSGAGLAIAPWTEPWKNNRHSTTNRFARREQTARTQKQYWPLPARRPLCEMRAGRI